jgi:hypothetical protein
MNAATMTLLVAASALAATAQTSTNAAAPASKSATTGRAATSPTTHVFVELPEDVQCTLDWAGGVRFVREGDGTVPEHFILVSSVVCLLSGSDPSTKTEIPLASHDVANGEMLPTQQFGSFRIKFGKNAADPDRISIESGKLKLFREFLRAAAKRPAQAAPTAESASDGSVVTAPAAEPVRIDVGQTIDQVTAARGTPLKIVNLGPRKFYFYEDVRVTVDNGKVSDVQKIAQDR